MFNSEIFILEFFTVYALTASTIKIGKITKLTHEVFDHSVENGTLVRQWYIRFSLCHTSISFTQLQKIFSRFRHYVIVQLKNYTALGFTSNRNIKKSFRSSHFYSLIA
ncbi:EC1118_1L7_0617p [Saccharomyces cerevisiae EC1118]|uniref:EC1118_1L7_0617p n=1 Tax=Saccharomyces cerevisiae (strain Lalvin EC1118 / Prise de mousse) TaxID=643680 RepID=C8ZDI1_YEAS8|nr:EC1118_1L7_0617p [Saccharomyces cerevisiae EC1118]